MIEGAVVVRSSDLKVGDTTATLVTLGLGSCVAVALHDPEAQVGGLAHFLLPEPHPGRPVEPPGRFASTGIPRLIEMLEANAADRRRIRARLIGGASMFPSLASEGTRTMGERNIAAARAALAKARIPVVGEDVGGVYGRSVYFRVADGRVLVKSVHLRDIVL
ncbi:MAG TPA: chemotaxis protein CheD [Longimicrobiales bacterium]